MKRELLVAAAALALAIPASGAQSLLVLPLRPEAGGKPAEGFLLAGKVAARAEGRSFVTTLDWAELAETMDRLGLDKRSLAEPETLRRLGAALEVDAVLGGTFRPRGGQAAVRATVVSVRTGRMARAPEWILERDLTVPVPVPELDAPVIGEEGLRDSLADASPCDGAMDRVDELERHILDLKARYWALQLRRGVGMKGLKFNPGSTITDPDLKREFYGRLKAWHAQDVIPELSPIEVQEFAENDLKALKLARRCGIL